jgi:hypothetical protein
MRQFGRDLMIVTLAHFIVLASITWGPLALTPLTA